MGLSLWNKRTKDGLEKAIEYFQQAIEKDTNYALAYALLADSYFLSVYYRYNTLPSREYYIKAKEAAARALELDASLAEAHTAMASVQVEFERDIAGAEKSYRRAIELNPNYAIAHVRYGWFLSNGQNLDAVVKEMRRAQELDPLSPTTNGALAGALIYARQFDEVIKYSQRALDLEPTSLASLVNLGIAYEYKGLYEQAIAAYQKGLEAQSDSWEPLAGLGHAYALTGRRAEAEKMLQKLQEISKQDKEVFYNLAIVYGALDDKDKAFEWLEKAADARVWSVRNLRYDPDLDVLRSDPRYFDILERHNMAFLLPKKAGSFQISK
jgi:tetratricopeptide (TPR) repeat protein